MQLDPAVGALTPVASSLATVSQQYWVDMLQRTLPAGFIAPCLPTKTDKLPSGSQWLHEIKHDGFRITGSAFYRFALACGEARSFPKAERKAAPKHIINVSYPGLCSIEQHILNERFFNNTSSEQSWVDPNLSQESPKFFL